MSKEEASIKVISESKDGKKRQIIVQTADPSDPTKKQSVTKHEVKKDGVWVYSPKKKASTIKAEAYRNKVLKAGKENK